MRNRTWGTSNQTSQYRELSPRFESLAFVGGHTMLAAMLAYVIYLEGPEDPEYVMHIFYLKWGPKYGNMLGNSLPAGPAQQTAENCPKYSICPQ